MSEKDKQEAKNEVKLLAALPHPNIVKYYEVYAGEVSCYAVYCIIPHRSGFTSQNAIP